MGQWSREMALMNMNLLHLKYVKADPLFLTEADEAAKLVMDFFKFKLSDSVEEFVEAEIGAEE